jgi:hypothetical protein
VVEQTPTLPKAIRRQVYKWCTAGHWAEVLDGFSNWRNKRNIDFNPLIDKVDKYSAVLAELDEPDDDAITGELERDYQANESASPDGVEVGIHQNKVMVGR